jgi:hypothetical protein
MVQKISNWLQIIADYLNKSYLSPYLNKKSTEKLVLIKERRDLDSRIFWLKLIPFCCS